MNIQRFHTAALAALLTLGTLSGSADAQGLELRKTGADHAAQERQGHAHAIATQWNTGPRQTHGESQSSQDFAADCNYYGGGASTDPVVGQECTSPDGENIIVPIFP